VSAQDKDILKKYKLDGDYFLYVGNVYPHKNLERLIKTIVDLNQEAHKKVYLAIVCSRNVFEKRLEQYVYSNKAERYVKFLGFVPDDDLALLYQKSRAFVYPTLSEGFGLPGLEAMAEGTIVAASDIPVLNEIYGDQALYFDPYDTGSITTTLIKVLKITDRQRLKLIQENKKFIRKYSWKNTASQTFKLYENCNSL
jgi:glycosyltransferase involved in cell wall biosynthesis